jgi:hypothetical protein
MEAVPIRSGQVPEIECPVRTKRISSLECHVCPNCIRVLYRGESPPEMQCSLWTWHSIDIDPGAGPGMETM